MLLRIDSLGSEYFTDRELYKHNSLTSLALGKNLFHKLYCRHYMHLDRVFWNIVMPTENIVLAPTNPISITRKTNRLRILIG